MPDQVTFEELDGDHVNIKLNGLWIGSYSKEYRTLDIEVDVDDVAAKVKPKVEARYGEIDAVNFFGRDFS